MDNFTAIGIAEGFIDADSDEQLFEAWQYLVDTNIVWQLQGWFGRTAMGLLIAGYITYHGDSDAIKNAIAKGQI